MQSPGVLPPGTVGSERAEYGRPPFGETLHLDVVTVEPPAGRTLADVPDPFVTLEDRGRFSRTLRARVVGLGGRSIREVALKIQSDEYPVAQLPGWSNRDVEEQWQRQWQLWTMAAAAGVAPEVLDVLPAAPDAGPPHLPPILYCKQRRAFFVAPCPQCAQPLGTCRDEDLLGDYGLPGFERSLERFLYCPACRAAGRELQFYALMLADQSLGTQAHVGEQVDLYRAFSHLAREGGPLPCDGCVHVPTCYPQENGAAADVVRFLTPLSFYDFRCLPLEGLQRTYYYDDFAAMLGGRPITGTAPERRYFFEDDPGGKLPLEILRLKLCLFSQLVAAVSGLHRVTRLPHLGLSPENALVDLAESVPGIPCFYSFRVRLVDIGGATRRHLKGLDPRELAVPLLDPPPLRDTTYAAPLSTQALSVRHEGSLSVIATSTAPDGRVVVEAQMTAESLGAAVLSPNDLVEVQIRQGRPVPLAVDFFATPTGASAPRIGLHSLPIAATPGLTLLCSLAGQAPVRATFVVHRCVHVPCDLQSLGLMLFATLAANAKQGAGAVTTAARKISAAVDRFVRENPGVTADEVEEYAVGVIGHWEKNEALCRRHLFDRPSTRSDQLPAIPDALWYGALLLGLRALTQAPEFGFCRADDDFDPQHPEGPADHLRAELDVLNHKIDAELFATAGKQLVFQEAVKRVRAELQRRGPAEARARRER